MTHDELLVKMDKEVEMAEFEDACGDGNDPRIARALRAVVKLHYPVSYIVNGPVQCFNDNHTYPCPTIQAIEKELG